MTSSPRTERQHKNNCLISMCRIVSVFVLVTLVDGTPCKFRASSNNYRESKINRLFYETQWLAWVWFNPPWPVLTVWSWVPKLSESLIRLKVVSLISLIKIFSILKNTLVFRHYTTCIGLLYLIVWSKNCNELCVVKTKDDGPRFVL